MFDLPAASFTFRRIVGLVVGGVGIWGCTGHRDPEPDRMLRIFVTASIEGALEPCACPGHPPGGRGRRVAARKALVGEAFWLDAGARWSPRADLVPWEFEAKQQTAFHTARSGGSTPEVLVVSAEDLAFGSVALRSWAARTNTQLVSSNLVGVGSAAPAFSAYALVERGGVKVGVVGGAPEADREAVRRAYERAGLTVASIESSIEAAAEAARAAGAEVVVAVVENRAPRPPGVDVVVGRRATPEAHAYSLTLGLGRRGRHVGTIDIELGEQGPRFSLQVTPLDAHVPEDPHAVTAVQEVIEARELPPNGALLYAGTRTCGRCHESQLRHWKTTGHAKAWNHLIAKRQTRNFDCVPCHGTGFLWPGGPRGFDQVRRFMHVGCEACHGPARTHVDQPQVPFGATVSREQCQGCHRAQNHQRPYVHAKRLAKILGSGHGEALHDPRRRSIQR